jgi:cobalt-zinc-cadmium efflux system outer membrane protein
MKLKKQVFFFLFFHLLQVSITAQEILSFRDTAKEARLRSPILLAEKSQILVAKGDLISAGILPNPIFNQMNLLRDGSGSGASYFSGKNRQDWYQISQTIPVAGQRRLGIEFAQNKLEVAKQDFYDIERNVVYGILSSWIDIWLGKNTLELLENGKMIAEELVKINELRLKNQVIT